MVELFFISSDTNRQLKTMQCICMQHISNDKLACLKPYPIQQSREIGRLIYSIEGNPVIKCQRKTTLLLIKSCTEILCSLIKVSEKHDSTNSWCSSGFSLSSFTRFNGNVLSYNVLQRPFALSRWTFIDRFCLQLLAGKLKIDELLVIFQET